MAFTSYNPATGALLGRYEEIDDAEIDRRLALAVSAFAQWKGVSFAERKKYMQALAGVLRQKSGDYARTMSLEMGKPISAARAEIEKCAWVCEYYADQAEAMLQEEQITSDATESYVRFDPIGVILAVMPWNFPFWQVFRFAAPAIMGGNVGVLKHASNVPACAAAIEESFELAGFPAGIFQDLRVGSARVEHVICDERVQAVTLTGSENAGSKVASIAGREIKKTVMELGGSDPFIIFADADMEAATAVGATARLQNAGQSCIAAKRFIVVESIADQFLTLSKARYEAMRIGDPLDETTAIGPLASEQLIRDIERQVTESVALGARVVTGGTRLQQTGYYFAPTILTGVKKGMPAYEEELFGPVASVIVVKDEEEAIHVANDTRFGLGASLWTRDTQKAKIFAARINAGAVFVNGMVKSDPRLPFGGIKKSGYGRELSHYGLKEFMNIKSVWIKEQL